MEGTGPSLSSASHLIVSPAVVQETLVALQDFGRLGHEGFVLWAGTLVPGAAKVAAALVPPQNSIESEDGVGYFLSGATLFRINRWLSESHMKLLAQVHSHPGEAFHSETDDRYAVVTTEGGFSIVVPNFARPPVLLDDWAVYRLIKGEWIRQAARLVLELADIHNRE